jgi:hypothetical protein
MPFVDKTNLKFFNGSGLTALVVGNILLTHDVRWLIFGVGPLFISSYYFILKSEAEQFNFED